MPDTRSGVMVTEGPEGAAQGGRAWPRILAGVLAGALLAAGTPLDKGDLPDRPRPVKPAAGVFPSVPTARTAYHPPHVLKVWTLKHRGRVFRCIQMPRCEHLEAVLAYNWSGETMQQVKKRLEGAAVCTDGFVHSTSYAPADFLQDRGRALSRAATGRWMFVINSTGEMDIHGNYMLVKGQKGVTAAALGQSLVPLKYDGFSKAFMNRVTDRMGIGLTKHHVFIGAGSSDIWRFAKLFEEVLHCQVAINTDGGHVIRGKSSTHIVFRWKKPQARENP